jgi:hypothetical protein
MASRTNVSTGIVIAQLDGGARYLLQHKVPLDEALAELRKIGATPEQIRAAADASRSYYADKHPIQAQTARADRRPPRAAAVRVDLEVEPKCTGMMKLIESTAMVLDRFGLPRHADNIPTSSAAGADPPSGS